MVSCSAYKESRIRVVYLALITIPAIITVGLILAEFVFHRIDLKVGEWVSFFTGLIAYYGTTILAIVTSQQGRLLREVQEREVLKEDQERRRIFKPQLEFGFVMLDDDYGECNQIKYEWISQNYPEEIRGNAIAKNPVKLHVELITPKDVDACGMEYYTVELSRYGTPQAKKRKESIVRKNTCYAISFDMRKDSRYDISFDINMKNQYDHEYNQSFKLGVIAEKETIQWYAILGGITDGNGTNGVMLRELNNNEYF